MINMNVKEKIPIKGKVSFVLKDKNGKVKQEGFIENTITALHDALVADRLAGGSDTLISYGHAGTGSGQGSGDTNLATPCAENRTALDSATQQAGGDDNDVKYIYTLGAGVCTATITELGLFTSQTHTDNNMMCYTDGLTVTKGASDTLIVTWTVTYGAS